MFDAETLKALESVRARLAQEERDAALQERTRRRTEAADHRIVGGIQRRAPINFAAAMLVARANWIAHPPSVPRFPEQEATPVPEKPAKLKHKKEQRRLESVAPELAGTMMKMNERSLGDALKDCAEARAAFNAACEAVGQASFGLKQEMGRMKETAAEVLTELRHKRMAMVGEVSQALQSLREVRQFFVGPDYERERERLAEFVDLCERLRVLRDCGFLDQVADTMLRLAVPETGE